MYFLDRKQGQHINKEQQKNVCAYLQDGLNTLSGTVSSSRIFYSHVSQYKASTKTTKWK